jgi:hypothetical protein
MTYAQYGSIQASDFNTLVGANPGSTINVLNTTWATGAASAGYGQPAEGNVTTGDVITASKWANLVNKTANAATHQGSGITSVTAPVAGGTITYLSAIPTNLTTIYSNKLNAATQSSTTSNAVVSGATWTSIATFTHTATFANGDAARYFFNSGGQLAITCAHANNTAGINLLLNNLCSNVGTVVMSAPTSGTATIAGTAYNGITRVGGGGNAPTISTNSGYYAWTTSNANVYYQTASTGPSGYLSTNINIFVKTNGTVGANGDVGNVVTITTVWDEIPNGLTVGTGSTTTLTVRPPEVTNLANTWGTISLAGSVTQS